MLVAAARAGDQRAWRALFRLFQPLVWRLVLARVRRYDQAADLVQEVFLRAFRKLGQLRDPNCFAGWLQTIVRNRVADWFRRRQQGIVVHDLQLDGTLCNPIDPAPGPGAAIERAEELLSLRKKLQQLRASDRQALEDFYLCRRSIKEMSHSTGKPIGTIKRRLHDARRRLAAVISRPEA
jgi:RNA polymerase sigma-70 factor (ECF subfamily)